MRISDWSSDVCSSDLFAKLLDGRDESQLSPEEAKEVKIMKLLLRIKNGTPPMRKQALRTITDKARDFGPGPLFNNILPLLMSSTLEDQEIGRASCRERV